MILAFIALFSLNGTAISLISAYVFFKRNKFISFLLLKPMLSLPYLRKLFCISLRVYSASALAVPYLKRKFFPNM